ncbi:MAG: alpha/beta hydrolase [Lachnospiraceae bacterium]
MIWIVFPVVVLILVIGGIYGIYRFVFGRNPKSLDNDYALPSGKQYDPYLPGIQKGIQNAAALPFETVEITSFDGIRLMGKYYQVREGAPIVIFFHGYRCTGLRDGNGLLQLCRKNGYNTLIITQRAHGASGGRTITFGIRERYDCREWIRYCVKRFGSDQKIVLAGISMGASTILMAAGPDLPENVKGIMADCGFSSPKAILKAVIKQMKLPVEITYRITRLGGKLFGGFDVEEYSAVEAMKCCKTPVLLIHGDEDLFVPCSMSRECYEACSAKKRLLLIPRAGHGLSYCVDSGKYEEAVLQFLEEVL